MCWAPISIRVKGPVIGPLPHPDEARYVSVPCGKCPACRQRRASQWSFRLQQELKVSHSSLFLTLTYDPTYAPVTDNGFLTLSKRDVQTFFKRLRNENCSCAYAASRKGFYKRKQKKSIFSKVKVGYQTPKCTCPKIRYYAVGEYGTNTGRPHYHIILFNAQLTACRKAWYMGQIHQGTVTRNSIGYTLKYISKDAVHPDRYNSFDDRIPQFSLMSKGLGGSYLKPRQIEFHRADLYNRLYVRHSEGYKVSIPRYYKDRIYNEIERKQIAIYWQKEYDRIVTECYELYQSATPPNLIEQQASVYKKALAKIKEIL